MQGYRLSAVCAVGRRALCRLLFRFSFCRFALQVFPVKILCDYAEALFLPDGLNFHLFDDFRFGIKGEFLF